MKKALALLLALALCVSLCACGNNNESYNSSVDKDDSSNYIGVWKSKHLILTINKGGIGRIESDIEGHGWFDFTYQIAEGVLVISIDRTIEWISSFQLSDDGMELSIIQNGLPFPTMVDGEVIVGNATIFKKTTKQ